MPEIEVRVAAEGTRKAFTIRLNEPAPSFECRVEDVFDPLLGDPPARVRDLVEIACAIFAADGEVGRGSRIRPGFGAQWYRDFAFTVPVRDLAFWSRVDVTEALVDAASFLTDDSFSFRFVAAGPDPSPKQGWLDLGPSGPGTRAEEVVLLSGGLDSLAGALETLASGSGRIVLVTHRSAQKLVTVQDRLVAELCRRYPGRVVWLPVQARRAGPEAAETTQRSRSLPFAALGYLAASLVGATRIRFFENGIVSLNLPIARQVVGTLATRTTHPVALRRLERLLTLVSERPITVDNPYVWQTKAEVVGRIAGRSDADLVRYTWSCSDVRNRTTLHTHCGTCSQCIDRRLAILAAGLAANDHVEKYETQLLTDECDNERDRTMTVEWTRHALQLQHMDDRTFASRFAAELSQLAEAFPHRAAWEVSADVLALHRRHGAAVAGVLTHAVQEAADNIVQRSLPETSLLRCILADRIGAQLVAPVAPPPIVVAEANAAIDEGATLPILPLKLRLEERDGAPVLVVEGLDEITGGACQIVLQLKPLYDEDRSIGRAAEAHRYLPTGTLAQRLGRGKAAVRQRISRCWSDLAERYEATEGVPPPKPLLIEGKQSRGYRLDPECRFLDRTGGGDSRAP